jgi:hypothetical protein
MALLTYTYKMLCSFALCIHTLKKPDAKLHNTEEDSVTLTFTYS